MDEFERNIYASQNENTQSQVNQNEQPAGAASDTNTPKQGQSDGFQAQQQAKPPVTPAHSSSYAYGQSQPQSPVHGEAGNRPVGTPPPYTAPHGGAAPVRPAPGVYAPQGGQTPTAAPKKKKGNAQKEEQQ